MSMSPTDYIICLCFCFFVGFCFLVFFQLKQFLAESNIIHLEFCLTAEETESYENCSFLIQQLCLLSLTSIWLKFLFTAQLFFIPLKIHSKLWIYSLLHIRYPFRCLVTVMDKRNIIQVIFELQSTDSSFPGTNYQCSESHVISF